MAQQEGKKNNWIYFTSSDYDHPVWNKYALGYKQASLILIEKYELSNDPRSIENLVYPIFFLYRHFTELQLKQILIDYAKFKLEKTLIPSTHSLSKLWNGVKPIINKIFFDEKSCLFNRTDYNHEDTTKLETFLENLNNYDKQSISFRYPVDKAGNIILTTDFKASLEPLKKEITETFSLLDFIILMIFHLQHGIFE